MGILFLYLAIIGIVTYFIPTTDDALIKRLEKEGYRHIVIIKHISFWTTEVNVNHNFLAGRAKIKVFHSVGQFEIDVIELV